MLYGSSYIYVEMSPAEFYKSYFPTHITDNIPSIEIASSNYQLPKYTMLKFRGKESDIDQAHNIFKMAINAKEWNVRIINNIFRIHM
jgi:hypothetical protein